MAGGGGMKSIYLIGSLRNPKIPLIANTLRKAGHEVFDDWHSAGEKADDGWKLYEERRGRDYRSAIKGLSATHVFEFDMKHIQRVDVGVLVLPAGKSGHLELGYMVGRGQAGYVLFEEEPDRDRWDLMYKIAHGIFFNTDELLEVLK
jgi:nucleoside 2-deoxyribosyltransferase